MINWPALRELTIASLKAYFRDFTAIFFTLIFPVIFLIVFGYINTSDEFNVNAAVFNNSKTEISKRFETSMNEIFNIDTESTTVEEARTKLEDDELHVVLVIPENFGAAGENNLPGGRIEGYYSAQDEFSDAAVSIVNETLSQFNAEAIKQASGDPPPEPFSAQIEQVESDQLTAIDYVIPGIIAFSIMSLGIFSISQGFITYKSSGAMRRLFVTPLKPIIFLIAQSAARLVMVIINVITMIALAIVLFDFQLVGSIFVFLAVSLIGTVMFLGFGFAIAGWAKNENQAAPISNIIFFPMMFLSGTFFPRELFPQWLQPITDYLPLTYLADGLREVANVGAGLFDLGPALLGMAAWTVVVYFIAAKIFRWE